MGGFLDRPEKDGYWRGHYWVEPVYADGILLGYYEPYIHEHVKRTFWGSVNAFEDLHARVGTKTVNGITLLNGWFDE